MENSAQNFIFYQNLLSQFTILFFMKIGVAERLDRRCKIYCLFIVFYIQIQGAHIIPEAGLGKDGIDSLITMVMHTTHQVCGNTDLNTMKLRCLQHFIQSM